MERRLWRCAMAVRPVCLEVDDAVELGEALEFIGDWLVSDRRPLAESLGRFLGSDGYDIDQLRADLFRFSFLPGVNDGNCSSAVMRDDRVGGTAGRDPTGGLASA